MPQDAKITTCCYCGARAALVLRGAARHELACGSCGAPLRMLKPLRAPAPPEPAQAAAARRKPAIARPKPSKRSRRGSVSQTVKRLFDRVFDDVFDEIEDLFD